MQHEHVSMYTVVPLASIGQSTCTLNCTTVIKYIQSHCLAGLQLRRTEGREAMESRGACVLGLIAILFLTPLASKAVLMVPLKPYELVVGLAVFCCMPTSLSANIALTGVSWSLRCALATAFNILGKNMGCM